MTKLTPTEERVLVACRAAAKWAIAGLNAPLVWSLMDREQRPSSRAVLGHMYALARKGHLLKTGALRFELPDVE